MQKLVAGIHHFRTDIFRFHRELFERLAKSQSPEALFITCSDARINPNLITQTDPGDLFILRNAGNLVPAYGASNGGEGATIELAVGKLGIQDIIICGHSGCGAMTALFDTEDFQDLPSFNNWLGHADATRRIMRKKYPHLAGEARLTATVEENVLVQLENLRTHPVVAAGLSAGRLKLHGWVYKIGSGEVFAYQPKIGQFVSLAQIPEDEISTPALAGTGSNGKR